MKHSEQNKKILIAPLNWGLGHATRCIPIIEGVLAYGFEPILAGDGESLELLKKEFPKLVSYDLPDSKVQYTEQSSLLKIKLLSQVPRLMRSVIEERKRVKEIHNIERLGGVISDNRPGVRLDEVPSIYITHQLQVLSGATTFFSTRWHQNIISEFTECWVPDFLEDGLAGKLSHGDKITNSIKYIGPQSRFSKKPGVKKWDLLVVLSGPEPQRTLLEKKVLKEVTSFKGKCLIVQGKIEEKQQRTDENNVSIVNYMQGAELQTAIDESHLVLSRSGYSSIMDLYAMEARAFFIPTPGQYEQEYLALYLQNKGFASFCRQDSFTLEQLNNLQDKYSFKHKKTSKNKLERSLFDVFN